MISAEWWQKTDALKQMDGENDQQLQQQAWIEYNKGGSLDYLNENNGSFGKAIKKINGAAQTELDNVLGEQEKQEQNGEGGPPYNYNGKAYDSKTDLYFAILVDKAADQFGIKDILAFGAALSGANILETAAKPGGATPGTSYASKYFRGIKNLSTPLSTRLPTLTGYPFVGKGMRLVFVNTLGKFLDRAVPVFGWGVLLWDAGRTFYRTQIEYNKIVGND